MCSKRAVFACLVITWLGCSVACAQLDSLRRAGDAREQYFKAYRLVWSVKEVYIYHPPPEDPQAVRQEAESLERQLLASGVRDVAALREQIRAMQQASGRRKELVSEAVREVEWGTDRQGGEFLFFSGVVTHLVNNIIRGRPVEVNKVSKELCEEFRGDGWGIQVSRTQPSLSSPLPVLVWCCTGHCARYPEPPTALGMRIPPDELSVIACLNALRINGESEWEVVSQTKDSIRVRRRGYLDTYGVFEIDMVLDLKRGGIPIRIVKRNPVYEGKIEVTRYTQSAGYWLPESVRSVFRSRGQRFVMIRERTWRLRGMQPKRGVSLERISSINQAVRGENVLDLRAYGCNLSLRDSRRLRGDKDVSYRWKGRLPTIAEVEAMLAADQRLLSRGWHGGWYINIIPPVLLITIGLVWYWRLRRGGT